MQPRARRTTTDLVPVSGPAGGSMLPAVALPDVTELLRLFLGNQSARTRMAYQSDLRDFAHHVRARTPAAAIRKLIEAGPGGANVLALDYRQAMCSRGLSGATRNRRLAALRSVVTMARSIGRITWTLSLRGEHVDGLRDTAGPGEPGYRAMLRAAGNARDRAILHLLHDLALRRGELVGLDVEHLEPLTGRLWILGKGRGQRQAMTLPQPSRDALAAWLRERGDRPGPLFEGRTGTRSGRRLTGQAVANIVARCAARAGLARVRPHGLRHTAITTALERTRGDVAAVARFSRHRSIQTLQIYDDRRQDLAGEIAELVAADSAPAGRS